MNLRRWLCAFVVLALVAGVAYVGQQAEPAGTKMTAAAGKFVASLNEDQKKAATFAFDDPHRTKWYFTPQQDKDKKPTRKGISFKALDDKQRKLALDLLASGTSQTGKDKALGVMALESILLQAEMGKGPTRDPDLYFLSIFGKPEATGKWGWRLEGHHLSLNFTVENGKVTGATPAFYGANPLEITSGDKKGTRTLAKEEDLARQLVKSLDAEQRKLGVLSDTVPDRMEIKEGEAQAGADASPKGLPAAKMTDEQKRTLLALLQEYAGNLAGDLSGPMMKEVTDAGIDKVHFAWWGSTEAKQKHIYRIQGPTFIVEYVNTQNDGYGNPASHIHSAWRSLKGDFGLAAK